MTKITFRGLEFVEEKERIGLIAFGNLRFPYEERGLPLCFVQAQIAGEDKPSHAGVKAAFTSEGSRFCYVSHKLAENRLEIIQRTALLEAKSVFEGFDDSAAVHIYTEYKNISEGEIVLEEASSFLLPCIGECGRANAENTFLWRFVQSHHAECQPCRSSFYSYGFSDEKACGQKRIAFANIGSWSAKEELPQGIVQACGRCLMFQIESNNTWYYEIADADGFFYLYLSGGTQAFGDRIKKLRPGEVYSAVKTALAEAGDMQSAIGEMTKYRRHIAGRCEADKNLPVIFNEYMHLSWDSPSEERTREYALAAAEAGADYYVIDCGWHDEEPGKEIYPYVGKWRESRTRFPHGIRKTTDYIRLLGMKAGLWIEPEIIGCKCEEMLEYYDDDCFVQRHGKRICVMGRYFLDYRNPKVIGYMTETIRRMAEDYGADYIKLDYNQDMGAGTELNADSAGEGLEQCAKAYLKWIDGLRRRFPDVLFETCASGGLRMDYETLKHFSVVSTSDQTDYKKYPYIAGNILSAVLPEQAAVWSYPVGSPAGPDGDFFPTEEWVRENISEEQVIMNMINSFLGRMHLASHIGLLPEAKISLVREGVGYYKRLTESKKGSLPVFPLGFTSFGEPCAAAGFQKGDTVYLAVWNLGGQRDLCVPFGRRIKKVSVGYPEALPVGLEQRDDLLFVRFTEDYQARFLEIELADVRGEAKETADGLRTHEK